MRNKLLLLLLLLLPAWVAWAQTPTWQSVTGLAPSDGGTTTVTGSAVNASGDYYVVGNFFGSLTLGSTTLTATGGTNDQDFFVAKFSSTTNSWVWAAKGGGSAGNDFALGVAASGNSVYVTGYYNTAATISSSSLTTNGNTSTDVFVAKYLDNGTSVTEARALDGGGTSADQGSAIAVSTSGSVTNVYVTGFVSTSTTTSTNVSIAGSSLGNYGGQDVFVARYTDSGAGLVDGGARLGGGTSNDRGRGIAANGNSVYVVGSFTTSATIGGTSLTAAGSSGLDLFVAKYSDTGAGLNESGTRSGGSSATADIAYSVDVAAGSPAAIYVTGTFNGTATIGTSSLTSQGSTDIFVAKYTDSGSGLTDGPAIRDGGPNADRAFDLEVTGNTLYVVGDFTAATTLAGSSLTSVGAYNTDAYVAKYTDNGSGVLSVGAINGGSTTNGTSPTTGLSTNTSTTVSAQGIRTLVGGGIATPATFRPTASGGSIAVASGSAFVATLTPAAPVLTSINPTAGQVGTSVTLTGSNLTGATAVTFSGTSNNTVTAGLTVNGSGSSQTITVSVPTGAVTGNVTVTTPGGTSNGLAFTVTTTPTVTTATATSVTSTSAVLGGNVTADGGATVSGRGVVFSSSNTTPTVGGSNVTTAANGSGTGSFSATITGLAPGTTYYVRTYATNSVGTSYGAIVTFTTVTPTITVAPATLPNGTQGTAYSQTLTASGGTASYSYAITAGALPSGLTLSTSGALSGTPTVAGSFTFTVTATDASAGSGPYSGSRSYSLTIAAPASTTVASVTRLTPSPTATAQVSYRVTFAAGVTGVTTSNFTPTTTGISGAGISSVSGSGTTYTVVVNTGSGNGTLRLDVTNATGITPSVTNTPYTAGETYTITKSFAAAPLLTILGTGGTGSDVTAFVDVVQVLSGGTAFANGLQNASFENHAPLANGDFGYNPTGASWTFNAQSGIAESGSAFTPTTPIPNGIAVAFVQSNGGGNGQLQQNLALPTGSSYQVSFQVAQRVCCTTLDQALNVFLNGVYLGTIQPGSSSYSTFTSATFAVAAPALTATVSTTSASPTSTSPIPFSVSFSQSVGTTFAASDVTVTNGTVTSSSFSGSGAGPYTFTVTPSGTSTVTVSVAAGVANDANNTGNSASNSLSLQYNQPATAAPVVVTPANGSLISTAIPTYAGTAAAGSTVTVYVDGAAIGTTTATGGNWAITQATTLAQGSHTVYATAQSPNASVSPNSNTNTFMVDTSRPSVSISSATGASGSTTSTSPLAFTVTFSEAVTGFVQGDLTVANGTVSGFAGSGTTYTFNVTPTTAGTATTVNVPANVAQDQAGNLNTAAPAAYALTFTTPVITLGPTTLPNGTVGVAYSQTITASGGTSPYSYAITAGALPVGLTLASNGTLAGTPTAGGSFTFTVTATDASTGSGPYNGARSYTLTIAAPTIVVAPATLPNGTQGTAYSQTITASGGTAPYRYAITAGALPSGLTLASGGTLSGTPTAGGSFTFTVTATDASTGSGPYSGSRSYTLTIATTFTVWTGAVSTDWFTAGNWTAGVPTGTADATIPPAPSGNRFPVITSGTTNVRNLTLNSGATLSQSGGILAVGANLTNNGTFQPTGGTVSLGSTNFSNILGSGSTRFWNLTVGTSGAQQSTSASTSVQRLLTLDGTFATNNNSFTLESNANGTALVVNNSGVISGNVTVQRYIAPDLNPNLGYRHVSAPISNATVASLATGSFTPVVNPTYNTSATPATVRPFPTVYGYDQSRLATAANNLADFDKGWFSPTTTGDALSVGQGYTALAAASQTWNFTGTANNGSLSQTLARNSGASAAASGLALVGNPYPSPLDWSLVPAADRPNVDPIVYVYTSNDPANAYNGVYSFYQSGFGNVSPVLPLGQGFFVKVTQGQNAGTLNLNNSHRVTSYSNPTYHRTAETRPAVHLTLQGAGSPLADDAFVYFEAGAADGYQVQYDGEKLPNPSGLNLSSSVSATQRLCVNGLEPLGTAQKVVPLAVGVPAVGSYILKAAELLNLSATPTYLRDLQTGAVVDLAQQPSYQFTVSNASALLTGRFELVFSPQQALATVPAALAQQVALYPNPAKTSTYLELPASLGRQAVTATLVDAVGREVRSVKLPAQGAVAHQLDLHDLPTGVYALRLQTSAGTVMKKLTVE